ncbi:hypothetical protein GGI03_003596 [Coemansia sp. RSA 2337]|nr:hypothetical protein H4S03_005782 [Coemansia sp. S3946]KAJ2049826.1 hypothetical protein H4S04_002980 [Coemansia sp. S16]KAJ2063936.1 hypothetical protein GGI08_002458 [Coemansia sp. S2]KAJ2066984.1 hypothetical protein GGH13_005491 [Coemansia sp. S155-1]KAJ2348691.1 hypothetical protein GGH92_002752 [Coemansia sp. RSA 2673]KAJ2431621.1 hypothetical protein GGF41_000462 [Coemansia sp. RSA 2531]KAJ2463830.1 hypothetical protein GGI03_003596 [Coemansia sp. RSA 2337]
MDVFNKVYNSYPCGEEFSSVRQFFWASVGLSWFLTFIPLGGGRCRNFSIVDRLWSLFPLMLVAQWVYLHGYALLDTKAIAAAVLVAVWSLRLTYNAIRRGDFDIGAQDYRWAHVAKSFDRMLGAHGVVRFVAWEIFNLGFIAFFQLGLVYQISVPVRQIIASSNGEERPWSISQIALVVTMAALLVAEGIADQQQFELQRLKRPGVLDAEPNKEYAASRKAEVEAGFVYSGLWRFSRHPNLFCEQAFWSTMVFFVTAADDLWMPAACLFLSGPAWLIALMWASVGLTESITLTKYPLYRAYQMKTSRLIPCVPLANSQVVNKAHRRQKKSK